MYFSLLVFVSTRGFFSVFFFRFENCLVCECYQNTHVNDLTEARARSRIDGVKAKMLVAIVGEYPASIEYIAFYFEYIGWRFSAY